MITLIWRLIKLPFALLAAPFLLIYYTMTPSGKASIERETQEASERMLERNRREKEDNG